MPSFETMPQSTQPQKPIEIKKPPLSKSKLELTPEEKEILSELRAAGAPESEVMRALRVSRGQEKSRIQQEIEAEKLEEARRRLKEAQQRNN